MAQLAELSLPIPEVYSSNPFIGKFLKNIYFTVKCIEKKQIKKKRPRMAHSKTSN